jgi:hypothetical protein
LPPAANEIITDMALHWWSWLGAAGAVTWAVLMVLPSTKIYESRARMIAFIMRSSAVAFGLSAAVYFLLSESIGNEAGIAVTGLGLLTITVMFVFIGIISTGSRGF